MTIDVSPVEHLVSSAEDIGHIRTKEEAREIVQEAQEIVEVAQQTFETIQANTSATEQEVQNAQTELQVAERNVDIAVWEENALNFAEDRGAIFTEYAGIAF